MPKSKHRKRPKPRNKTSGTSVVRRFVEPSGIIIDQEEKRLIVITKDVLINQLRRDGPKIEASFDKLCEQDLRELSECMSTSLSLLYAGLLSASQRDMKIKAACSELLFNASNSFGAATQLLRAGYCLQPGIVIRSMLEAISTVLHLIQNPNDFSAYQSGKLQSTQTINAAKKAIPPFGQMYGYFSENFAHVGHLHRSLNRLAEYSERHDALETNLGFLRFAAWLFYVTIELLFNELVENPRYWHPVTGGFAYDPSEDERKWVRQFLDGNLSA